MALKQAEDGDRWVLRCYESAGETASFEISGALGLSPIGTIDLLERPQPEVLDRVMPWRIASVALAPTDVAQASSL
jgi:alpha-mannosidase